MFRNLIQWDPLRDIQRLQQEMNRLFAGYSSEAEGFPYLNVWGTQDSLVVTAEIPGVDPKDLSINVNQGYLTVEGERKPEELEADVICHRCERGFGKFARSLQLPFEVDVNTVKARHKLGVLSIEMQRTEAAKPKKIAVASE